jgi:polysaccharide biosynthesis protein PslH
VVVPLRIGGGTRLKIYEAMAAGRAVVSTTVGAEGLQVHNGKDIILADSPQHFAAAVVSLLLNNEMRNQYEVAAAELASHFDWSAIGQKFVCVLSDVIAGSRRSSESCVLLYDGENSSPLVDTEG